MEVNREEVEWGESSHFWDLIFSVSDVMSTATDYSTHTQSLVAYFLF